MTQIVVPFRGRSGKRRDDAPDEVRSTLALAMHGDVLAACIVAGRTLLVSQDEAARTLAAELGAEVVDDPGGGQGAAVEAAMTHVEAGPALVVNADVPCVVPRDLRSLAATVSAAIPNLADDVDTLEDLQRVGLRAGPRTQAALAAVGAA